MPPGRRHEVWIDRGGTFTDCVLFDRASGGARSLKVLSSDLAPVEGIRALLGLGPDEAIPPCDLRMGTTLATNALLERKGAPCVLVVNRGFGDVLRIGHQTRRELFSLRIEQPSVLYERVVEIDARQDRDGRLLSPLDEGELRRELEEARKAGIRSISVALIHAHVDGGLEEDVARIAGELGFGQISLSHRVAREPGLVGRGDTTVADAYLTPVLHAYMERLAAALPGSRIRVMQSSGGLSEAGRFRGRDAILSGPAGGVVAVASIARELRKPAVVGFDMGGTSTDVCRFAGELERSYETEVAGVRLRAPMMAIHTVAAGGGSICRITDGRLTVGPESAGADPGPLCYGRAAARDVTLTDVAVALGRVLPEHFPFPLMAPRAIEGLEALAEELGAATGSSFTWREVADGFLRVAVESMAAAIREVSVARGHDVRDHAMIVFGGAGGQYAGAIARLLGVEELIFHPLSGVLSAYGIGCAAETWHSEVDLGLTSVEEVDQGAARASIDPLIAEGRAILVGEGVPEEALHVTVEIDLRYRGTRTAISVPIDGDGSLRARFEAAHERRYGYLRAGFPVEAATARVEVHGPPGAPALRELDAPKALPKLRMTTLRIAGEDVEAHVLGRREVPTDCPLEGPAVILDDTGTIVVEPGFTVERREDGALILRDHEAASSEEVGQEADPVLLEVFNNLFMSVAEQMGHVLRRTALSTNIRDRLDFSCALFDMDGGLVANAPHIPVHLGAMSESVRAIHQAHPDPQPGAVYVTNDPSKGGSHLPDITVVSPFHDADGSLRFWIASRGHHADVGGITPGSMPPFATRLEEEGVVLRGERIVSGGVFDREKARALFSAGPYPARRPDENLADLEAHIAANRLGALRVDELVARYGLKTVEAYMGHVQRNASEAVRAAIAAMPDGERSFEDALDGGERIRVRITIRGETMAIDFAGTDEASESNLNAPRAVTLAAVLYVVRTLVGRPIPLNGGCLDPVTLSIPIGSLIDPPAGRAVASGNVETSQRVVDVLLGALGVAAASQGTMNNLTFGDTSFGYYETIGGGAGALPDADGASGVHTHMTNSRITDPEVLEASYPVQLVRFSLRRGSGGAGRHRGGDGLVREIRFFAPLEVAIVSERRRTAPYGLAGGEPGSKGQNFLDGRELPGRCQVSAPPGSTIRIETPGGGGYGSPDSPGP